MDKNEWLSYGKALTDALGELQSFEKTHEAEFAKLKGERDGLLAKSAKLGERITGAETDLAALRLGLFADLGAAVAQFKDAKDAAKKLEPKALAVAKKLRERGVELLRLRLEQNRIDQEAAIIAQRPCMARFELANRFLGALIHTASVGIQITRGAPSFDHASELSRQGKVLIEMLNVAEGKFLEIKGEDQVTRMRRRAPGGFAALGRSVGNAHDVLSFAEQLPEAALPGLVQAWGEAVAADAVHVGMRYDANGLKWHITTRKSQQRLLQTHDLPHVGGDVMGRSLN